MKLLSSCAPAACAGKRVVVRASLNVPINDGDTKQKFRIAALKDTVDFLCDAGAQVALLGHMGRPDGAVDEALSMAQLTDDITRILDRPVVFADACTGARVEEVLSGTQPGTLVLLENVRFHSAETSTDAVVRKAFAAEIAQNFDVYVNDAFSVCHRAHASITELATALPSYAGMQLSREVETLSRVRTSPAHPAVLVIGGAKIATKLPLIRAVESLYDAVLVGGKVANEALDEQIAFTDNVMVPQDFVGERYDIGPATVEAFVAQIMRAQTVVWNGPMGWYEKEAYAHGTRRIVEALKDTPAFTVVGGGESIEALEHYNAIDAIDFVSTGGGAMLAFMAGDTLPGIAALE